MTRLTLIAASALALASAAPAAAFTGRGLAGTLRERGIATSSSQAASRKAHTCQAGHSRKSTGPRLSVIGDKRSSAVVACEQPPRSEVTQSLRPNAAGALGAIG